MKTLTVFISALLVLGCAEARAGSISYGRDALPSAEVEAFQRLDARLKYRDARIGYDTRNCAVYEGRTRGRLQRRALRDARGRPICARRR